MAYWKNFCGWPDLLIFNEKEFFFTEIKSSNDKLSEEQKNWLEGNYTYLQFNSKILKIGKLKK
ncbi:MAG: VRR-NUC domain-containing protein [Legionella sp.]|nr:VRR-NUC domain-containing protein [Legionella sp.]